MATSNISLPSGVAVLTGAASGIGRALALNLARNGWAMALVDRDAMALSITANAARAIGATVSEHLLDLTDTAGIDALPADVLARHGRVTLLVNNAGVGLMGDFVQTSVADFDWVVAINFTAVVHMTRVFLPSLLREPAAQLVNISSIFGIIAPPGNAAYSAAKFAVRGFSESLRHELEGTGVGVSVVHPGGVATNIAKTSRVSAEIAPADAVKALARFSKSLVTTPDAAAARIIAGISRREKRILIGRDARILDLVQRVAPVGYYALLRKRLGRRPPSTPAS